MPKRSGAENRICVALLLAMAIFFCAACQADIGNLLNGGDEGGGRRVESSEIKLPMSRVRSLNPLVTKDKDSYFISKLLYEGLFELDDKLCAVPKLCESYEYGEDGLSLKIRLKSGVLWHDGETLSAEDVKFTVDSLLNFASYYYERPGLFTESASNIRSLALDREDALSFTIYFKSASDAALEKLTFPIVPKHLYRSVYELKSDVGDFSPVGTGPYMLSQYNGLKELKLVPFERYHGEKAKNDLNFIVVPSGSEAISLMNIDEISLMFMEETERETLLGNVDCTIENYVSNEFDFIGFNLRRDYFADKAARRAVAYAFDAESAISAVYFSSGVRAEGFYHPAYMGLEHGGDFYDFDLEKAGELLRGTALAERFSAAESEERQDDLALGILVRSDVSSSLSAARMLVSSLESLGLRCALIECDEESYRQRLAYGDFDLFIGSYSVSATNDLRPLLHSGYGNLFGYSNTEADRALDLLMSGAPLSERKEALEGLEKLLKDELPYYPFIRKTYGLVRSAGLRGESEPQFFDRYRGAAAWYLEYELE